LDAACDRLEDATMTRNDADDVARNGDDDAAHARGCGSVGVTGVSGVTGPGLGARPGSTAGDSLGCAGGISRGEWPGGVEAGPGVEGPGCGS
jgi:hypothetical protein